MKIIASIVFILAVFLTACSSEPKKMPYTLSIKEKGIGLITKETPFDHYVIESKLLGFEVLQFTFFEAGVPHPLIRVSHNAKELFLIYPTDDLKYIQSISIQNADIANDDATIGSDYKMLPEHKFNCSKPDKNQFTCKLRTSSTLEYLFVDDILKEITWKPSR